jgi:hypothetical protein
MSDTLYILKWIYIPGTPDPTCMDAADANDDGVVEMSDAIYLLNWLYMPGSPSPPPPYPDCGIDLTQDDLDCESHLCT